MNATATIPRRRRGDERRHGRGRARRRSWAPARRAHPRCARSRSATVRWRGDRSARGPRTAASVAVVPYTYTQSSSSAAPGAPPDAGRFDERERHPSGEGEPGKVEGGERGTRHPEPEAGRALGVLDLGAEHHERGSAAPRPRSASTRGRRWAGRGRRGASALPPITGVKQRPRWTHRAVVHERRARGGIRRRRREQRVGHQPRGAVRRGAAPARSRRRSTTRPRSRRGSLNAACCAATVAR